jgi:hypothetical protein
VNFWVSAGPIWNWEEAFKQGGIWGVEPKPSLKKRWDRLSRGDILAFYVSRPVSGVIGIGRITGKHEGKKPLWPEEKKRGKVIWRYRFNFDIIYRLENIKSWKMEKIHIADLRIPRAAGLSLAKSKDAIVALLQRADVEWGTNLAKLIRPEAERKPEERTPHEEMKTLLYDIGVWQGMISEKEYRLDGERLDVAWIKKGVKEARPRVAFEIHLKGNPYTALGKLKDANDKWRTKPVIVTSEKFTEKINHLLGGTFHEIAEEIKILMLDDVRELYEAERKLSKLKREKTLVEILD